MYSTVGVKHWITLTVLIVLLFATGPFAYMYLWRRGRHQTASPTYTARGNTPTTTAGRVLATSSSGAGEAIVVRSDRINRQNPAVATKCSEVLAAFREYQEAVVAATARSRWP